jgi:NAD+ kinase
MLDLKCIGIYTRDNEQDYRLNSLRKVFRRANIEVVQNAEEHPAGSFDLIFALGGDGTVLQALSSHPGTPVLAVNFGTLGFLTAADRSELDNVLVRLLSDDYLIEERLTLEVRFRGQSRRCVNEVVVKGTTRLVAISITINDHPVHTPRGDGIIVGTSTGSTAYLMSTGAPIVAPEVDCIIVQPLNEYSFSSRGIIVPGTARIRLNIEPTRETDIILTIDGGDSIAMKTGDEIEIARSTEPVKLLYFDRNYFFGNLKRRLGW